MSHGIYVALSGALAQSDWLDTTATNLANASTDGYQRMQPVFREVLARQAGNGTVHFGRLASNPIDPTAGTMRATGRALDVALPAGSYLSVQTARGERYTRAGSLRVGNDGTLQTANGDPVLGDDQQPIRAANAATDVQINAAGDVLQGDARVGHLRVVSFAQPSALTHEGATLLAGSRASGAATQITPRLEVGTLEGSNQSVVGAMIELVTVSRSFEAFQRAIQTFNEADRKLIASVPSP